MFNKLASMPEASRARVWVFFYCQAGKHRSVGAEFVCRHLLLKENQIVSGPLHLSSGNWRRKTCAGECSSCRATPEQSKIKSDIINKTHSSDWRSIWRSDDSKASSPGCCLSTSYQLSAVSFSIHSNHDSFKISCVCFLFIIFISVLSV